MGWRKGGGGHKSDGYVHVERTVLASPQRPSETSNNRDSLDTRAKRVPEYVKQ